MVSDPPIYLDHHATTPVDSRVLDKMLPFFSERFGNASSRAHRHGARAKRAVEAARREVATLLGAPHRAGHIVFTSGATESNNIAIRGVVRAAQKAATTDAPVHVITVETEHKAVLETIQSLSDPAHGQRAIEITVLPVDAMGFVSAADVEAAMRPSTALVSVMHCNNEVGTLQPLEEIGAITRAHGVALHCDATQGLGLTPFDVEAMNVDLVSLSAHKLYGPQGVGALYFRRSGEGRVDLLPLSTGGGHEHGIRPGTLNVPGIVGLGAACELVRAEGQAEAERLRALSIELSDALLALPDTFLNGPPHGAQRHPGNVNISFGGVEGEGLLLELSRVMSVSSGAACTSATAEPSHVLKAIGRPRELADASIRYGLGRSSTTTHVDTAKTETLAAVAKLRAQRSADAGDFDW